MAEETNQEMRDVVLSRPCNLQRDDGSRVTYPAGPNTMPVADAEHWYLQHHLAPDSTAPLEFADGETGAAGVQALIMQRDSAQASLGTLQREVRRVTDLWTESEAKRRAAEVELTTLRAAQGTAQRTDTAAPPEANSQLVILRGQLAAAEKRAGDKDAEISALTQRAEAAEGRVKELEADNATLKRDLENGALAEAGGATQPPPAPPEPLPETEADEPDDAEADASIEAKVVKRRGKFYISRGGELSEQSYDSRPAAQAALAEEGGQ